MNIPTGACQSIVLILGSPQQTISEFLQSTVLSGEVLQGFKLRLLFVWAAQYNRHEKFSPQRVALTIARLFNVYPRVNVSNVETKMEL